MSLEAWGDEGPETYTEECPDCEGEGVVDRESFTLDGVTYPSLIDQKCDTCDGEGFIPIDGYYYDE